MGYYYYYYWNSLFHIYSLFPTLLSLLLPPRPALIPLPSFLVFHCNIHRNKMENGFKMRISRMFRSSLGSCRSKDISDVIERVPPIFIPDHHPHNHRPRRGQLMELFSPKLPPPPLPPPPRPQTDQTKKSSLLLTDAEGQRCPPVSPISPFLNTTSYYCGDHHDPYFHNCLAASSSSSKVKEKTKKTKKPKRVRSRIKAFGLHDEFPACSYNGLFSSDEDDDDEDDKTTLFSSRSLSSDSSDTLTRSKSCRMVSQRANPKSHHHHRLKRGVKDDSDIMGARSTLLPGLMEGKVKDSFAVVKCSSDPYNDFRTSMVEMIVERQLFSGDELEKLLQCFLSLNSYQHHGVIVQVFTEIWEALFSHGS